MDTVFTTQDVARNKRLKIALVKNLTGCSLLFQTEIQQSVDAFVKQMRISKGQSIDLSYWSFFWSFDITYALLFGSHYGYMESRADVNHWIYTFKNITSYAAIIGQKPEWCKWTLANQKVMSFLQLLQPFPDPVSQFIQVFCPYLAALALIDAKLLTACRRLRKEWSYMTQLHMRVVKS